MVTTIADSIAICLLNNDALLTAIGNELHLHSGKNNTKDRNLSSTKTKLKHCLNCKIHGIKASNNEHRIIVYGEKQFMLLSWRVATTATAEAEYDFELLYRGALTDWISAALFLNNGGREFVLHTAHSVLLHFAYENATCQLLDTASCSDKSTLYCSHLHGTSWAQLVVFSGNAFGELLIWQPLRTIDDVDEQQKSPIKCQLLQRISAHNGVIFSIDYNVEAQLLITTSDDRSIKFWRIEATESTVDWQTDKLQPLVSGFGHNARVFQGKIIEHENAYYGLTVGEDSNFCIWNANGKLLHKQRAQFGATIWNLAFDALSKTLYTVGSTGNVLAHGLKDVLTQTEQTQSQTLPALCSTSDEFIAKVKFLTSDLIIGVSNENRLLYYNLKETTECSSWLEIEDFQRYKCTVLEVHNAEGLIVLCGYKHLTLYAFESDSLRFSKRFDGELLPGVIRAFHFLNANSYLVSDEQGNCLLLKGQYLTERTMLQLPDCKERWLTTALLLPDEDFLLASNRNGNMLLYQRSADGVSYELMQKLRQPHGYLGATVLELIKRDDKNTAFIRSAGHDGTIKMLHLCKVTARLQIYTQQLVPVAWVEALPKIDDDDLLLLGFNDNRFVAWTRNRDFLLQLACGGGHRYWHYQLQQHNNNNGKYELDVVFIKLKQVLHYRVPLFADDCHSRLALPPRNLWHVRPCNVLRLHRNESVGATFMASAGDDNLIKISKINDNKLGVVQQLHELHAHISNVRCLQLVPLEEATKQQYLAFSGGGRAQLCIAKIQLNANDSYVQELANYTLKPSSGKHTNTNDNYKNNDETAYKFDAETRIMTLDILQSKDDGYKLYLGCSDGYLRLFKWNSAEAANEQQKTPEIPEFTLLHEVYLARCLLQVRYIADIVLAAATDGVLHCYSADLQTDHLQLPLHSSGINALDVLLEQDKHLLHVLTGGDDQALAYTQLTLTDAEANADATETVRLQYTHCFKELHTAQVTAASLQLLRIRTEQSDLSFEPHSLSSGVDQNLIICNLRTKQIVYCFHSCIADIKGLSVTKDTTGNGHCYLYGCGLQIIRLDKFFVFKS